jgi:adenosylcobinamide-GDP ribazoletransferase
MVASALSLAATVWLTGAFHEDGLADTCDALGGAVSRERALAIMKDSRIGSYGAVALVLALVLKVATVSGLAGAARNGGLAWAAMALIWSHAVSRAAPVWLVWRLPYAGDAEHAKAKPLATQVSGNGLVVALIWVWVASGAAVSVTVLTGASSWATALWAAMSSLAACASVTLCCARWLRRRLGGFTGDTLGATQQIVELVGLLTWLAWLPLTRGPHA